MNSGGEGMTRGVQGTEKSSLKGLTERVLLEGCGYTLFHIIIYPSPIIRTPQSPRDKRLLKYFSEVSRVWPGGMAGGDWWGGWCIVLPYIN